MHLDDSALYAVLTACVAISAFIGAVVWRWFARARLRHRLKRRFRHALEAETRAPALLRELGYEVLGAQVNASYVVTLDATPIHVPLRADFVVARAGLTFVAEVKSGKLAPKLTSSSTRRQLLEYLVAFGVNGVLLVDADSRRVHEVVFPSAANSRLRAGHSQRTFVLAVAVVAVLVLYYVLRFAGS